MSLATDPASPVTAIQYGGFRFPEGTLTDSFVVEPVKDAAGRTVIYSRFRVTLKCHLNLGPGQSVAALTRSAAILLSQPGQAFRYLGRGLGDFGINIASAKDCMWGPFPTVVELKHHNNQTVRLTWTVEFHLPTTCANPRYDGPMEFNYSTAVDIDRYGLSTRTYKGFLRIAQNRVNPGQRAVLKSADDWRWRIQPPLIPGFRRTERMFELSADKCRLDFSFRDEEFEGENAPPPDVIEADAEHTFSTSSPGKLMEWVGSLTATYIVPKRNDFGVTSAVQAFAVLARDRLTEFLKVVPGRAAPGIGGALAVAVRGALDPAFVAAKRRVDAAVVPISFAVSDASIYGKKTVRLDMKYRVAGASLADILEFGGLWKPVPRRERPPLDPAVAGLFNGLVGRVVDGNKAAEFRPAKGLTDTGEFELWSASLKASNVFGERGTSELVLFYPGEDQIVDLCGTLPGEPKFVQLQANPRPEPRQGELRGGALLGLAQAFPPPPPEKSWVSYEATVRTEEDSGVVVGRTLPDEPLTAPTAVAGTWNAGQGVPPQAASNSGFRTNGAAPSTAGETFAQRRVRPIEYVILEGYAVRAGHPVPVPKVVAVGNRTATPANRTDAGEGFEQAVVGQAHLFGAAPVYAARWRMRYVLSDPPATSVIGVLPNPVSA